MDPTCYFIPITRWIVIMGGGRSLVVGYSGILAVVFGCAIDPDVGPIGSGYASHVECRHSSRPADA